jgi:hypothetical protein
VIDGEYTTIDYMIPQQDAFVLKFGKISTIELWHQDQNCLFLQGDYRNRGFNHEETVLGLSSGADVVSVAYINN